MRQAVVRPTAHCAYPAARRALGRFRRGDLPHAVSGSRREFDADGVRVSYYTAGPAAGSTKTPLVLIHSVNAAAAAHEVRPLYEHYRHDRPVYAVDLPGYGFSDRGNRFYTPRLMTDAVHALLARIRADHGDTPVDAIALSLSCEFVARAATERPPHFRSLTFVAPTGFNRDEPFYGPPGSTRGKPRVYRVLTAAPIARPLFNLLTCRPSVRLFLEKTWGGKAIDEHLFEYSWRTARQRGAHHAPYCFLSGFLFSADISRVYESLPQPVWMVHGVRGDFTDFRRKRVFESAPNWRVEVFQTGALPHFEVADRFNAALEDFLDAVVSGEPVNQTAS